MIVAGFLIDTSTLSLLAPGCPNLPEGVAGRLRAEAESLYLSTVTLAEIREGICKLRRKGAPARADALDDWLATLRALFASRVLSFGPQEADESGALADAAVGIGRHPGFPDVAIAGTAKAHGLAIVTENGKHFEPLAAFGVIATDLAGLTGDGRFRRA